MQQKAILAASLVVATLVSIPTASGAAGATAPSTSGRAQGLVARVAAPVRCPYARLAVAFYRGHFVRHQLQRRASVPTWRKPRNCADARYLATVWAERAKASRLKTERWLDARTLHAFRDWHKAVREAQRPYPGTEGWLMSCSASEGGWGRWFPNSQGSGVGGWMQMFSSTWSTMFYGWSGNEGALSYLTRKGFIVPRAAHSWYSPLGQALAAAHGKLNGRGGEWYGSGC